MTYIFVYQRFGPSDQDYYYKKCDEPQPDSPQDPEDVSNITNDGENNLFLNICLECMKTL